MICSSQEFIIFDPNHQFYLLKFYTNIMEDKKQKEFTLTALHKLGIVIFAAIGGLSIIYSFGDHSAFAEEPFLNKTKLFLINAVLGLAGGLCFGKQQRPLMLFSSLIAAIGITGLGIFYLSWRDSVYTIELVLILAIGAVPGIFIFQKFKAKPATEENESNA